MVVSPLGAPLDAWGASECAAVTGGAALTAGAATVGWCMMAAIALGAPCSMLGAYNEREAELRIPSREGATFPILLVRTGRSEISAAKLANTASRSSAMTEGLGLQESGIRMK